VDAKGVLDDVSRDTVHFLRHDVSWRELRLWRFLADVYAHANRLGTPAANFLVTDSHSDDVRIPSQLSNPPFLDGLRSLDLVSLFAAGRSRHSTSFKV
jgi:hypothetical protein